MANDAKANTNPLLQVHVSSEKGLHRHTTLIINKEKNWAAPQKAQRLWQERRNSTLQMIPSILMMSSCKQLLNEGAFRFVVLTIHRQCFGFLLFPWWGPQGYQILLTQDFKDKWIKCVGPLPRVQKCCSGYEGVLYLMIGVENFEKNTRD